MAKIGIVDLGTNSLRIEIYEVDLSDNSSLNRIHREVYMPRIGSMLYTSNSLNPESKDQILSILLDAQQRIQGMGTDLVLAVATSALRESEEGPKFIDELNKQTGMALEIISGEEEAYLTAQGILHFDPTVISLADQTLLFVDIGGGSTEFSICENARVITTASLALGAIRAHTTLLSDVPAKNAEMDALRTAIRDELGHISEQFTNKTIQKVFGSSGTIRSLCKLPSVVPEGTTLLFRANLSEFIRKLSVMEKDEILAIEGLEENRADIILGGSIILEEIMRFFDIETLSPSRYSLRHGLLNEGITQLRLGERNV